MSSPNETRSKHRRKLVKTLFGEKDTPISTPTEEKFEPFDIKQLTDELQSIGSTQNIVTEENIKRLLGNNYVNGDHEKAKELLEFFRKAVEGELVPIVHRTEHPKFNTNSFISYDKLLGADNLQGVTCYLDTLMFAMFARLENFEPILYKNFELDEKRENLAIILRFYINMLRSGKLITTDITKILLDTLISAGWVASTGPNKYEQHDTAELFNFITETLSMPLLTLKVDIAHPGKEDEEDDHKLINERLLLVPVPGDRNDPPVLLEECLENYFSNNVQVSRQLERSRVLSDVVSGLTGSEVNNEESKHSKRRSTTTTRPARKFSLETIDPKYLSLVEQKKNSNSNENIDPSTSDPNLNSLRSRALTLPPSYDSLYKDRLPPNVEPQKTVALWNSKNEIKLQAWMFLQLLPFYSDMRLKQQKSHDVELLQDEINKPKQTTNENIHIETDASIPIEKHFANARPVLGICLKRYSWTSDGESKRNDRQVLVPQTIHLPSFVADDSDEGSLFGNFKLILESAIFHRGNSINSGHFVAICAEDPAIDYDEIEIENINHNGHDKRRNHRRHFTHRPQYSNINLDDNFPKSQPPSGRNSESGTRPRRWIFFDDLQAYPNKTKSVEFDEIFEKECPYLLFYRMVSADDDRSSSYHSITPPTSLMPPLAMSQSLRSDQSDVSTNDTFINVPAALTSTSTFSSIFSDISKDTSKDTAKDKDRGRERTKDRKRLFRISRGKSALGSPSRSQSAPPDKRTSTNEILDSITTRPDDSILSNLGDTSSSSVYLELPQANPSTLSVSAESKMSMRSFRRKPYENVNSYNVDEKCIIS